MLATTPGRRFPEENCLLASLPDDEYARLAPALEHVWLAPRQILGLPDESISRVYFPRTAVASLLVPMQNGSAVEGATVGKEGMLGLEGFLGGATSPVEVVVPGAPAGPRPRAHRRRPLHLARPDGGGAVRRRRGEGGARSPAPRAVTESIPYASAWRACC